jgi:hypothetical protein
MIVFVSSRTGQQAELSPEDWEKSLQVADRFVEHYFSCSICQMSNYRGICYQGFWILTGGSLGTTIQ